MKTLRLTDKPFKLIEFEGKTNSEYQESDKTKLLEAKGTLFFSLSLLSFIAFVVSFFLPVTVINSIILGSIGLTLVVFLSLGIRCCVQLENDNAASKAQATADDETDKVNSVNEDNIVRLIAWAKDEAQIDVGRESAKLLLEGDSVISLDGEELVLVKTVDDKIYLFQGEFEKKYKVNL
jgi:hypothetical protein